MSKLKDWDDRPYCGNGLFSTGPNDPFAEECAKHDQDYLGGGGVERLWGKDVEFYRGIWRKALRNPLLIPRAILYTVVVNIFARFFQRRESRL